MSICHRVGDSRTCGASTVTGGNQFLTVDGQFWSVVGDSDSHGDGELMNTQNYITINGKYVILVGDPAAPDDLCPLDGGAHCSPSASSGDSLINVS